jgi:hypothetical protein
MCRLLLTLNPQDSCWELYAGSEPGMRGLLGWITDTQAVDAGVPQDVAALLTGALCRCVTQTFLWQPDKGQSLSDQWETIGEGQAKHLKAGLLDRVRGNPSFTLLATLNPAEAENLFYNEKFSWELRAQRVFLSPIDVLPDLDYRHVSTVFNWPANLDVRTHFQGTNVLGLLLPGVDGDFAELVVFDEVQWPSLQQALSQQCAALEINFQIVDESTFKQTKWVKESP